MNNPPTFVSHIAVITGVHHHVWLRINIFYLSLCLFLSAFLILHWISYIFPIQISG
jgi:hypothetical protein